MYRRAAGQRITEGAVQPVDERVERLARQRKVAARPECAKNLLLCQPVARVQGQQAEQLLDLPSRAKRDGHPQLENLEAPEHAHEDSTTPQCS